MFMHTSDSSMPHDSMMHAAPTRRLDRVYGTAFLVPLVPDVCRSSAVSERELRVEPCAAPHESSPPGVPVAGADATEREKRPPGAPFSATLGVRSITFTPILAASAQILKRQLKGLLVSMCAWSKL